LLEINRALLFVDYSTKKIDVFIVVLAMLFDPEAPPLPYQF
jgi:hypothetical protein